MSMADYYDWGEREDFSWYCYYCEIEVLGGDQCSWCGRWEYSPEDKEKWEDE